MYNVDLAPIYQVYKKIKHSDANAILFNPLVINTSQNRNACATKNAHYGATLSIRRFNRVVTPLCTTVIYIDIPDEFELGRLGIMEFGNIGIDKVIFARPKIGRKLTFRGDAYHYVEPMLTKTPQKRISLVFEHYKLTAEEIDKYAQIHIA
jgi:hypothetical protein